jgi:hypothetical protein
MKILRCIICYSHIVKMSERNTIKLQRNYEILKIGGKMGNMLD